MNAKAKVSNWEMLSHIFIGAVASLGIIAAVIFGVIALNNSTSSDTGKQSHSNQQNW